MDKGKKEVEIMKKKNHMEYEGQMRERERDRTREGDKQAEREGDRRGCRVHRRYGNERRETGK